MPKNILACGTGNLDVAANALVSTANFLKAHGWRAGAGYQPPMFRLGQLAGRFASRRRQGIQCTVADWLPPSEIQALSASPSTRLAS
jgi:membrane-bound lytic murein transglycosylase B